jgi:hypothetical protein
MKLIELLNLRIDEALSRTLMASGTMFMPSCRWCCSRRRARLHEAAKRRDNVGIS